MQMSFKHGLSVLHRHRLHLHPKTQNLLFTTQYFYSGLALWIKYCHFWPLWFYPVFSFFPPFFPLLSLPPGGYFLCSLPSLLWDFSTPGNNGKYFFFPFAFIFLFLILTSVSALLDKSNLPCSGSHFFYSFFSFYLNFKPTNLFVAFSFFCFCVVLKFYCEIGLFVIFQTRT